MFHITEEFRYRFPAVISLVVLAVLPSDGIGLVLCPFYLLTDIPCPACGLSRSMSSLLHFEINKSLVFHPLGSLVLFFLLNCAIKNVPYFLFTDSLLSKKHIGRIFSLKYFVFLFFAVWSIRVLLFRPNF